MTIQERLRKLAWPVILAAIIVVVDQIVKALIVEHLRPVGSMQVVGDLLRLVYVTNDGVAFGLLQGAPDILSVVTTFLIFIILFYLVRTVGRSWLLTLALSLELGGAIGNLIDRVRLGYVVDFVKVPYWPAFNVADSCVVVGAIILVAVIGMADTSPNRTKVNSSPTTS